MKKTISMMLAVVLCMGLFAGCGDKSKAPKEVTEIVEGVNNYLVENHKTEKENFVQTEVLTLQEKKCYVFESVAIDKKSNNEYTTSMKFICNGENIEELEVETSVEYGLNLASVESYMKTRDDFDDFKYNRVSKTKSTYEMK